MASIPNVLVSEYILYDSPPRSDLVVGPLKVVDGYIEMLDKPGLGIELYEETFQNYPSRTMARGNSLQGGHVDGVYIRQGETKRVSPCCC